MDNPRRVQFGTPCIVGMVLISMYRSLLFSGDRLMGVWALRLAPEKPSMRECSITE